MRFRIEKMGCGGCAKAIGDTIRAIDPKAGVDIDLDTKRISVTSDADQSVLQAALAQAGYPAAQIA